ncbi:hypothetical protein B0T10DRAFT_502299 [Thelonectria olida]|uniref:Uncharacterized protein n=1 Tax=Thelonectria olida TaxID=1576542 RepID=A0A9P9AGF9_9HYPO|nr:hypothetical protein B0T10DRAFT_502299 [Thelonectria olida]
MLALYILSIPRNWWCCSHGPPSITSGLRTESDAGVTHTPQAKLAIRRTRRVVDGARFAVGWNVPSKCAAGRMSSSRYAMCLTIRRL